MMRCQKCKSITMKICRRPKDTSLYACHNPFTSVVGSKKRYSLSVDKLEQLVTSISQCV